MTGTFPRAILIAVVCLAGSNLFAAVQSDTTFSGGAGDYVRPGDSDDFYGVIDGTGPFTIGGTTIAAVDTSPGIGDWLLQSDIGNTLSSGTVMTTLNVATPDKFKGLATFSWDYDEEGDHEGNDDLIMEIVDVGSGAVLGSKIIGDDQNNSPPDKPDSLSVDASGATSLQARIVYDSGFDTGGQDGEEIQISNQLLSADDFAGETLLTSGWTGVTEAASGGDFYGVLDAVGAGDAGTINGNNFNGDGDHTNNSGDDSIAWAVGDFVLEGNASSVSWPISETVLATMDLALPSLATDIDLLLSFTQDREGTLEANDSLRFEIFDVDNSVVLDSLTLADDSGFTVGDTLETLSVTGLTGSTNFQARLVYVGGFADGNEEEIQIGNPAFSAAFTLIPEPSTFLIWSLFAALGLFCRRRR